MLRDSWYKALVALVVVILSTGVGVMAISPEGFIQRPVSVTVSMGSFAPFSCMIDLDDYDGIFWYLTEENIPHYLLPAEYGAHARTNDLPNNILLSTLTINARETTNNTRVLCKGDLISGQDIYSIAYMTVVGMDSDADVATMHGATTVQVQTTTEQQFHSTDTIYIGTSIAAVELILLAIVSITIIVSFYLWKKKNARGIVVLQPKVVVVLWETSHGRRPIENSTFSKA